MKSTLFVCLPICLLASVCLAAPVGIQSYNSNIDFPTTTPTSLRSGEVESNAKAFGYVEQTNYVLLADVPVDIRPQTPYPNDYDYVTDLNPGTIAAGTVVNSYLVVYDPVGSSNTNVRTSGTVTITFAAGTKIVGIQIRRSTLSDSDSAQLQLAGVTYETRSSREYGLELQPAGGTENYRDWVHVINDHKVSIRPHASGNNIDELRILTTTVPEPATMATGAIGLLALAFYRRRRA